MRHVIAAAPRHVGDDEAVDAAADQHRDARVHPAEVGARADVAVAHLIEMTCRARIGRLNHCKGTARHSLAHVRGLSRRCGAYPGKDRAARLFGTNATTKNPPDHPRGATTSPAARARAARTVVMVVIAQ